MITEVADYCETDVVNTYRVWLRYELFRGRLSGCSFSSQGKATLHEISRITARPDTRRKRTSGSRDRQPCRQSIRGLARISASALCLTSHALGHEPRDQLLQALQRPDRATGRPSGLRVVAGLLEPRLGPQLHLAQQYDRPRKGRASRITPRGSARSSGWTGG
jgi:Predicted 3'-5' exonuclease related to the exonuclease domain of PolB